MKFLCESCKAKYQIADDKLTGKTLKMKCRKCGHLIEIKAATESSSVGSTVQLSALGDDAAAQLLQKGTPALPRPSSAPSSTSGGAPNSALHQAFKKESLASAGTDPPGDDWYVSIDEVPVGPIRLNELRSKYSAGNVTDDSLIWREGFEEWRPLKTIGDVYSFLRAEASARPGTSSQMRAATPRPNAPARPASPSTPATSAPSARQPGPSTAPAPNVRGNVIPFGRTGGVAARKLDEYEEDEPTQVASRVELAQAIRQSLAPAPLAAPERPDPIAAPAQPPAANMGLGVMADPFAQAPSDPFAQAPAAPFAPAPAQSSLASASVGQLSPSAPPPAQKKGLSGGVVALIGAACVLVGVVAAVMILKKPEAKTEIVEKERIVERRVEVPVSASATGTTVAAALPTPSATVAASASADPTGVKVAIRTGPGVPSVPGAPTPSASGKISKSLGGVDLGPEGPDPTGGGPVAKTDGALDGSRVEAVARSKSKVVNTNCYQEYVGSGGPASVRIRLQIAPDGSVTTAAIESGSPASFTGCVQRLARGWRFPTSSAGGTFVVPFVFN